MLIGMVRASLGIVALVAAAACGQTEHGPLRPVMTGPAAAGEGVGGTASSGSATVGDPGDAGGNGLAGMGGLAPVQSAVAECQRYCETLNYRLPQALCEDWNDPAWDPPYCHMDPMTSCGEYCTEVYQTVTPQCAALLAPVIRCVAPVYASGELSTCFLGECHKELFALTSACYGLQKTLAEARATWQASSVVDYQLTYSQFNMKAQVVVRDGLEPVATPSNANPWTVPKLFDAVDYYLNLAAGYPRITYDAKLGYVVGLSYFEDCDRSEEVVSGVEVTPLR